MKSVAAKKSFPSWVLGVAIVAVMSSVLLAVGYTNITLRSIEKKLPNDLLIELNALSTVLEDISEVAYAARFAAANQDAESLIGLKVSLKVVHQSVLELRDTYVINNLVNASAFHSVVAPAIADLEIWLSEGVSGYGPESAVTLEIAEKRIQKAYAKARALKYKSQEKAQSILNQQLKRLERFQLSATILLVLTLIILCCLIYLLIRQSVLIKKEMTTRGALAKEHSLLESLLQNIPLGIAVWDKHKNVIHLNNHFTQLTGYDQSDMPKLEKWPLLAYPNAGYRKQVREDWKQVVKNEGLGEYKVTCKNGAIKEVQFRATFLPDSRVINTLIDVTERNENEKALRESRKIDSRAKKMESLGLLAGGVAHDLNNILSGIVSYPELILMDLDTDEKLRKRIEVIRDSGEKATAIVQDLLTIARGVAIKKEPIQLNTIIEEYLKSADCELLQRFHPDVQIKTSLTTDQMSVMGSRVHIRKILMNLVSNGCEAIEAEGTVLISTKNSYVDRPFRGYAKVEEGEYVVLTVTDQGEGITDEDLDQIFEPFYSKKKLGRSGTGLGLAVVWNVVQDHDGYINVTNSTDGTSFSVYLPVTRKRRLDDQPALNLEHYKGHGESILIVDDVPSQREITTSILEKLGYKVEAVSSGEAAVEYIKQHAVELILLDMIMDPGMNGRETYEKILQIQPEQKAIIVSGFVKTEEVNRTLELGASCFLKKPLMIRDIGIAIHQALH